MVPRGTSSLSSPHMPLKPTNGLIDAARLMLLNTKRHPLPNPPCHASEWLFILRCFSLKSYVIVIHTIPDLSSYCLIRQEIRPIYHIVPWNIVKLEKQKPFCFKKPCSECNSHQSATSKQWSTKAVITLAVLPWVNLFSTMDFFLIKVPSYTTTSGKWSLPGLFSAWTPTDHSLFPNLLPYGVLSFPSLISTFPNLHLLPSKGKLSSPLSVSLEPS